MQVLAPTGHRPTTSTSPARFDITADVYDTPPLAPPPPWDLARLAPAAIWWDLLDSNGRSSNRASPCDFDLDASAQQLYSWIYAPGTYQNKPHRPGNYVFWIAHGLDTTSLPDGTYTLVVTASDTRHNVGTATLPLTLANGTG